MSFAVIKTGGKQYKVLEGEKLLIEKLDQPVGAEFDFEEVLMIGRPVAEVERPNADVETGIRQKVPEGTNRDKLPEDKAISGSGMLEHWDAKIGTPLVEGAKVRARVLEHAKSDKKIVFKYTRKTRYKKKKGHRQPYTKVEILQIIA